MSRNIAKTKAFTLIELLVVIAVIAVLMAVLMPSLQRARKQAASARCLSNARQISLAWYSYMSENDSKIVSATVGDNSGWVDHPRRVNGTKITSPFVVIEDEEEQRGIEAGKLYPYLKDVGVYHCPADKRVTLAGSDVFRTYSMPQCLNAMPSSLRDKDIRHFDKIRRPADKYMLIEEADMREFNHGSWSLGTQEFSNPPTWWDPLAVWHGNSSILGFCDGHAERHTWNDEFTKERMDKLMRTGTTSYGRQAPPSGQITDLNYMLSHWPYQPQPLLR
ncbi:type II secretion system protein [Planctomycetota bacterium]